METMGPFPSTRWSLIYEAAGDHRERARAALGELLEAYLPALRAHLRWTRRLAVEQTEDLLQGFVADKVMLDGLIAQANANRGRFRSFVLKALDNYWRSRLRHESAAKRSPAQPMTPVEPERDRCGNVEVDPFDWQWAQAVVAQTIERVREDCRREGRPEEWQVLHQRVLEPIYEGVPPTPYDALVEQLGLRSPAQAANLLTTAKRRFGRALRDVISAYVRDQAELEAEIAALHRALSGGDAGSAASMRSS